VSPVPLDVSRPAPLLHGCGSLAQLSYERCHAVAIRAEEIRRRVEMRFENVHAARR